MNAKKKDPSTVRFALPELRTIRLDLGLTKEEFKAAAGVSRATIDKIESKDGFVTESTMAKVLRAISAKSDRKYTFSDAKKIEN